VICGVVVLMCDHIVVTWCLLAVVVAMVLAVDLLYVAGLLAITYIGRVNIAVRRC
jgi:hypothetical protein